MGVLECGAMAMRGYFDVFDQAIAAIEHIEHVLDKEDVPIEFHPEKETFDGEQKCEAHFFDPKGEWQADLKRAKDMVNEACQIAQNTMAAIP